MLPGQKAPQPTAGLPLPREMGGAAERDLHLPRAKGPSKDNHFVLYYTGGVPSHGRGTVGCHNAVPPGEEMQKESQEPSFQ